MAFGPGHLYGGKSDFVSQIYPYTLSLFAEPVYMSSLVDTGSMADERACPRLKSVLMNRSMYRREMCDYCKVINCCCVAPHLTSIRSVLLRGGVLSIRRSNDGKSYSSPVQCH